MDTIYTATQSPLIPLDLTQTTGKKKPRTPKKIERQFHSTNEAYALLNSVREELNERFYASPGERPAIHSPGDLYKLLRPFLENLDHEEFWVVVVNVKNCVVKLIKLYQGSQSASTVRISEVFREAIIYNASSIFIAHNHPSGDPTPSPEDVSLTRAVVQAGKTLDIDVLDHLIIGQGVFKSLKECGLGF